MSDEIEEVLFPVSYLPAGTSDLGSDNWIIGYNYDYTTDQYLDLVYGAAGPDVAFGVPLPSPYQTTPVEVGGALSGDLFCDSFSMQGGGAYTLLGTLSASSGDIGSGTLLTVNVGASLMVTSDFTVEGTTVGVTVSGSVYEDVESGGTATGTTISASGIKSVSGSDVALGGLQVFAGGVATDTTVDSGGIEGVYTSGLDSGAMVSSGGIQWVIGGTTSDTVLSGGFEAVQFGGTTISTTVNSSGTEYLSYSGSAISATVNSGGTEYVSDSTASFTRVNNGGYEELLSGGTAINTTVSSGGFEILSGGTASGTTVSQGGTLYGNGLVYAPVENDGQIIANGGTLVISGAVDGTGVAQIDDDATLELTSSFAAGGTVNFVGVGPGTLILDHPTEFSGMVTNLSVGDQIVLPDTGWSGSPGVVNGIVYATIGSYNGTSMLEIGDDETDTADPNLSTPALVAIQASGSSNFSNEYFQVSQSGANTVLTLAQGNPIVLAVSVPAGLTGTGIKIGIISGPIPSQDPTGESAAIGQIISDIAPGASLEFMEGDTSPLQMASAINTLQSNGCNIIVDDVGFSSWLSSVLDTLFVIPAINAAYAAGITYVSAAGNDYGSVSGHDLDPNALIVGAMNILATPNLAVGDYIPTQTELSSDQAISDTQPGNFITGPDGGATGLPLGNPATVGFYNPFFGTSAAAPAVAAVAALMMKANPALESNPLEVYLLLEENALRFVDNKNPSSSLGEGFGLVQANKAVAAAAAYTGSGTTVNSGSIQYVSSGETTIGTTVNNGGGQTVLSGGTAISTTVNGGGTEVVSSGGTASGTTVNGVGYEYVSSGGTAISTTVNSGGTEVVSPGGAAISTIVNSSGLEYVSSGGTAISTTVSNGGTEIVSSGGTASGTALASGGAIDVAYLPYVSGGSAGVNSSDLLTVSEGGETYTQQLSGNYTEEYFVLTADADGNTLVTAVLPTFATLVNFDNTNGAGPEAGLIADANGDLFGTAVGSPEYPDGTVFEIAKTATGYASAPTTLVSFNGMDGYAPTASLITDADGDLFGTTYEGGANDDGTVFELVNNGGGSSYTLMTLVSFDVTNGSHPSAGLITDANGDLFGTTYEGGVNDDGTVFEIEKTANGYASTPTILVSFDVTNGSYPSASLITDANGDLFGTTGGGGASNDGTVFEIAKTATGYADTPTTLVSFNLTNGFGPNGSLITDDNGDLFGGTTAGGANFDGTVFEIAKTASGYADTPTTLVNFNGTDDEGSPGNLIADANGDLFSITLAAVLGNGTSVPVSVAHGMSGLGSARSVR